MAIEIYNQEARRIISLIKNNFILPDGSISLKRQGGKLLPYNMFFDLGDLIPFFAYFGEKAFIEKQLGLFENNLISGVMVSQFSSWKVKGFAKSYEYSDLLLGLLDYYYETNNNQVLELLISQADKAVEIFNYQDKIKSWNLVKLKLGLPIVDCRDGMMIELFCQLSELKPEKNYLAIAKNIADQLLAIKFYQQHKIFPTLSTRGIFKVFSGSKFNTGEIAKTNTNTLFGLLAIYQKTKEEKYFSAITEIIEAIKNKAVFENGIIKNFNPDKPATKANLTASFMVLEFLCDFYNLFKRPQELQFARGIADYWLSQQSKNTGLFPLWSNSTKTFVDSETDMTIALVKLYELSGEKKYQEASNRCLEGILKHHGGKDYVLSVDVNSGAVVDDIQKTKFLSLFLKVLILKIEQAKGAKIYNNEKLLDLLKDR